MPGLERAICGALAYNLRGCKASLALSKASLDHVSPKSKGAMT